MCVRIKVNPLDTASIQSAINDIKAFEKKFEKNLEIYMDRLAEVGRDTAQSIFGSTTSVTVEKTENGRKIIAVGTDEAYFVEFGTGVHAGTTSGDYIQIPAIVYPGSYSENVGKHTWSAWINAGNSEESYPYNSEPKSAMYKAYEAMCMQSASIAREVFGT